MFGFYTMKGCIVKVDECATGMNLIVFHSVENSEGGNIGVL